MTFGEAAILSRTGYFAIPARKNYSFTEVIEKSTAYFNGDSLAANVWANKYALKNSEGHLFELTPDDMHRRIAREIARIEKKYPNPMSEDELFGLMRHFKYIVPQGSPMAGIGNDFQIGSLSNCFVIGNEGASDSYGAIMKVMGVINGAGFRHIGLVALKEPDG